ncbi:putative cAMP receptor (Car4) [Aspergillus foveolatus]|uniref:putative cAMP receptor (Car4) n=1 Tax=Aspergillus foveolatus TaxID=210207 RepID=UPI003CCE1674
MKLSSSQLQHLSIAGRTASALSLVGVATIIATFCYSPNFRSPTHRIMLINAFFNLFDFIATMISVSGPAAGNESGLCRFQAFSLQMFPVADVLWTLAMTWDVVLVVFWHYEPEALRRLEKMYLAVITLLTFIPALVFLFIRSEEKGPLYGSVTFWCSISPNWVLFRIISYYAPIWFLILVVFGLYIAIAHELFKLRHELMLTRDDCLVLSSSVSPSHESVVRICHHDGKAVDEPVPVVRQHSAVSLRKFLLMPILFFLALLTTWVTPTINRIYAFRHPGQEPYGLMVGVAALGSLRGFWNGIIFVTMRSKGRS